MVPLAVAASEYAGLTARNAVAQVRDALASPSLETFAWVGAAAAVVLLGARGKSRAAFAVVLVGAAIFAARALELW